MDNPDTPEEMLGPFHCSLTRTHRWLGNIRVILNALRQDALPVHRVLDVGCGAGDLMVSISENLGAEVVGVDLRIPKCISSALSIVQADAVRHPLPRADVAVSLCVAHHLSETEIIDLIRNVGRSCRRFILVDLVRHRIPFILFRIFVSPFLNPVNAADGFQSIRRSYTPAELRRIVSRALAGSEARFHHSVAPLFVRQIVDISYVEAGEKEF